MAKASKPITMLTSTLQDLAQARDDLSGCSGSVRPNLRGKVVKAKQNITSLIALLRDVEAKSSGLPGFGQKPVSKRS